MGQQEAPRRAVSEAHGLWRGSRGHERVSGILRVLLADPLPSIKTPFCCPGQARLYLPPCISARAPLLPLLDQLLSCPS